MEQREKSEMSFCFNFGFFFEWYLKYLETDTNVFKSRLPNHRSVKTFKAWTNLPVSNSYVHIV